MARRLPRLPGMRPLSLLLLFILVLGAPWQVAWLSLLGPAFMLVSLYWVTGIPFVEAQAVRSRGDDYRDYQRTTSAFIPWFPKPGQRKD